jgi:hypothetical protein
MQQNTIRIVLMGIASAVAVYLLTMSHAQRGVGNMEFAALAALLVVTWAAMVRVVRVVRVGSSSAKYRCVSIEAFVADSSRAIYEDMIRPRLDRMIYAASGGKKTTGVYDEDNDRVIKEATGRDIATGAGLDGKLSTSLKVANEFRVISAFLCYCAQSMEKATLLQRLGVKRPVYV